MSENFDENKKLISSENTNNNSIQHKIQPILVKWEDINYTVNTPNGSINVLQNVSGYANPGELLAIMGPSGSGKTSLLSVLSQTIPQTSSYSLSGSVKYNNKSFDSVNCGTFLRYVPQESILLDFLTPYETLFFMVSLKYNKPKKQTHKIVENYLEDFNLTKAKDTIIGNNINNGISGGEKKRLAIAVEYLTNPSVIILDEPTSGLDSMMANEIMNLLQNLASQGINVVFSIHQPSFSNFQKFDRLILMQLGRIVYQGRGEDSLEYFSKLEIKIDTSPPEYYMKMLRINDKNNLTSEENELISKLMSHYNKEENYIWRDEIKACETQDLPVNESYKVGFFHSLRVLLWRTLLGDMRSPVFKFKLIHPFLFSLIILGVYVKLREDSKGINDRKGVLLFYLLNMYMGPLQDSAFKFCNQYPVVSKDVKEGKYSLFTYYLSRFILELPFILICASVYTAIDYIPLGLNSDSWEKYFNFYIIGVILQFSTFGIAVFISALIKQPIFGMLVGRLTAQLSIIVSGAVCPPVTLLWFFDTLKYLLPFTFAIDGVLTNEFEDSDIDYTNNPKPGERIELHKMEIYQNEICIAACTGILFLIGYLLMMLRIKRNN